jgi:aldehyde:ferredoxin oxidoreductase
MAGIPYVILHVDLTSGRRWSEDLPPAVRRQFVGARGVNAWLFWREATGGIDPLGPDNPLIFGAGLLTGTNAR